MRNWLDNLAAWLDSPVGGIVAIGLPILLRALWPKLSSATRKRLAPRRKKGAKHQNYKHQDEVGGTVEPGVGL